MWVYTAEQQLVNISSGACIRVQKFDVQGNPPRFTVLSSYPSRGEAALITLNDPEGANAIVRALARRLGAIPVKDLIDDLEDLT